MLIYTIAVILKSTGTELPLTLTVRNKSRIIYTVGIHFTDSQFHNGILSCPFLMEQSDLSQGRRKLTKAWWTSNNVVVQSALPVDIGFRYLVATIFMLSGTDQKNALFTCMTKVK